MTNTLIRQLEEAENQADTIRRDAVSEARDMVKGVEEAITAEKRQFMKDLHAETQQLLEKTRADIQSEITSLEGARAKDRLALKNKALKNVDAASKMIFERVVGNGNR